MLGRRGQEEAPIELLIAVALLTFVLIIGAYAYDNFCKTDFEQKMKTSLGVLRGDMEQVYRGSVGSSQPSSVDFSATGCSGDAASVRILKGTQSICQAQLGLSDCLLLAVTSSISLSSQAKHAPVVISLNIPSDATIKYVHVGGPGCSALRDLEDFTQMSDEASFGCEPFSLASHAFLVKKTGPNEITIKE